MSRRFVQQRLIPTAMEPRAVLADPMPATQEFTLWTSTQVPHFVRILMSTVCGIPEQKLRVVAPDVGGGFGGKLNVYAEEAIALAVARRLGRPVKWTASRGEDYQATTHGRDMIQDVEIAANRDGRALGLKVTLTADMGAYLQILTPAVPLLGRYVYPGIYKFDAHEFFCRGVFTTKTPTDSYRGAGRPEATFAIERIMDELAAELGMDPLELRRRNWITSTEFPYTTITGLTYDSGDYEAGATRAAELFGYDELRREQAERRQRGDRVQLGIGVSTYTEMVGLARPAGWANTATLPAAGRRPACACCPPEGSRPWPAPRRTARAMSPRSARSSRTRWVSFDDVDVLHGDTDIAAWGLDTYGSRSLVVGGTAVLQAARKVVDKARVIAAHLLEASPDDLEFADGRFSVRGDPAAAKTIQEVAFAAFAAHDLPAGADPVLLAEATFDPETFSYPAGTHLCAAEVDTQTGRVTIRSYVAVDDVGKAVNPTTVEGQIHGGVTQGLAQARTRRPSTTARAAWSTVAAPDHPAPSAADVPPWSPTCTPNPGHDRPAGAKSVGDRDHRRHARRSHAVADARAPTGDRRAHAVHAGAGVAGDHPHRASGRAAGTAASAKTVEVRAPVAWRRCR